MAGDLSWTNTRDMIPKDAEKSLVWQLGGCCGFSLIFLTCFFCVVMTLSLFG